MFQVRTTLTVTCPACGVKRTRPYCAQRAKELKANGCIAKCTGRCGVQGTGYKRREPIQATRRPRLLGLKTLAHVGCGVLKELERQEVEPDVWALKFRCNCGMTVVAMTENEQ